MRTTIERLPDGSDYVAILHGPILLAAKTETEELKDLVAGDGRMAHVSTGPYPAARRRPDAGGRPRHVRRSHPAGRWAAADLHGTRHHPPRHATAARADALLSRARQPLRRLLARRHTQAYEGVVAQLKAQERSRLALEGRTLDRVSPGEQQPEVEHNVRSEGSTTGRPGAPLARGQRAGSATISARAGSGDHWRSS